MDGVIRRRSADDARALYRENNATEVRLGPFGDTTAGKTRLAGEARRTLRRRRGQTDRAHSVSGEHRVNY